jgi:phenylacetate-coenzyme A ligase PaaK-like adenylate-forming protein
MRQVESQWEHKIFEQAGYNFEGLALEIFRFQYAHNPLYRAYADALKRNPEKVGCLADIPFLPIRFFKTHSVTTTSFSPELVFESSGTTSTVSSRHFVKSASLYRESFTRCFELFYGPVSNWQITGLLPSYLERGNSSLVYMTDRLIKLSGKKNAGFYLNNIDELAALLYRAEKEKQPTLLLGATFGLLNFAERHSMKLQHTTIMETGGMKGRRKEMVRAEVHEKLKAAFGLGVIHSEYGMTELLSQAYSKGEGIFACPPWMKALVRDEEDPLNILGEGRGGINIIDLANLYSCCFIATDDAGVLRPDGQFEILGRLDGSDLRGCSLLTI